MQIERTLRKRHADPVHALLCERLSRRGSQDLVLNPEITSIMSEGLRLMQTFRDRRMVVSIERKRKAPEKE